MKRFIDIITKYLESLLPGLGFVCIFLAGNDSTLLLGLIATTYSLYRIIKGD